MSDVHARAPERPNLELHRVGLTGIRKPLSVQRAERVVTLAATFEVGVDLPANRKGSDLSRNAELLAEVVDESVTAPVASLEGAAADIAVHLLDRHRYARRSTVRIEALYFRRRGIRPERASYEDYLLLAEAGAERSVEGELRVRRRVGVEAVGMTACPCAMEGSRERLTVQYPALAEPALESVPTVTHNQRNRTRLWLDLPDGVEVEADELLDAVEAAQSSPTYAILKREDEARLVLDAHRHPKFVEDVLRDLLASLPERFPGLPDATGVRAETRSEESIHKYDVLAAHETDIARLRRHGAA